MRILGMSRVFTRALAALGAVVASLAAVAAVGIVSSSPASASTVCRTLGHTYLTQNGGAFVTFGNNVLFGSTPSTSFVQGNMGYRFGGNGIQPGTQITFYAVNTDTGAWAGLVNGGNYTTRGAGSNCVVNEEGPFTISLPPGNYRVMAQWIAGQTGNFFSDAVVDFHVQAPPPPPPYDPYDPGYGGFNCGGYAEACF